MKLVWLTLLLSTFLARATDLPRSPHFERANEVLAKGNCFSFLVMIDGRVVHEDYRDGGRPDRASELASGTKSFCGVLALCAVEDGLLTLDEKASATLSEWRDDPKRRDLTIRQLLNLTSGIPGRDFGSAWGKPPSYRDSIENEPRWRAGQRFSYGPIPFQIFGEIMRRKLESKGETVAGYLRKKILQPLDIWPGAWRRDVDGQPHLPSGAALTARDWAKFGECVRLDGRGVLPPGKLAELFVGTDAKPGYGVTWWLPGAGPIGAVFERDVGAGKLPRETWMAAGAGGQRCVVIPSLRLVAVCQARVRLAEAKFDEAEFLAELVAGARRVALEQTAPKAGE